MVTTKIMISHVSAEDQLSHEGKEHNTTTIIPPKKPLQSYNLLHISNLEAV